MDGATAIRQHRGMLKFRVEWAALLLALVTSAAVGNGIDVRHFARAPLYEHASLSPDGAHVSYVDQIDARQTVFIRDLLRDVAVATLQVEPPSERVRWCGWADVRYVLCGTILTTRKQHAIVERTKLYSIDSLTRKVIELNSREGVAHRDQVIDLTPAMAEHALLQIDTDGLGFPEVVELHVGTGKTRVVQRSHPPIRSWMSDGRGTVRLGLSYEADAAAVFVPEGGGRWRPLIEQSLADVEAIGPLAIGANDELYVLKHHRGRAALFRQTLAAHAKPMLVFADPMFDISGPLDLDPVTRQLLAVRFVRDAPVVEAFTEKEKSIRAWLDRELPDVSNIIVGRTLDGSRLLVRSSSDTDPPSLYVAEVVARRLMHVGHQYPELESRPLVATRSLIYSARDGQRIPAFLSLPSDRVGPGPAVVLPHGGPETRDVLDFDPLVQFLAARGYAVLRMNFRGSLGYGAGFAAAGAQQWGGVIHNDITDGARWLVAQKIAPAEQLCIVGASFGGYAALLGAARESEWYACAASYAGPSDLLAFLEYTARLPDAALWRERLGHDPRALWQMSPMAFVWRIETPVLLMHGVRDAVVPLSQSRRMARTLANANKPHRLQALPECDHDMTAERCRLAVFSTLDVFLSDSFAAQ